MVLLRLLVGQGSDGSLHRCRSPGQTRLAHLLVESDDEKTEDDDAAAPGEWASTAPAPS